AAAFGFSAGFLAGAVGFGAGGSSPTRPGMSSRLRSERGATFSAGFFAGGSSSDRFGIAGAFAGGSSRLMLGMAGAFGVPGAGLSAAFFAGAAGLGPSSSNSPGMSSRLRSDSPEAPAGFGCADGAVGCGAAGFGAGASAVAGGVLGNVTGVLQPGQGSVR